MKPIIRTQSYITVNQKNITDNETLRNILIEYIKMRSFNKKKLTDKALNLMLKKLNSISSDDNPKRLIVKKSLINIWSDFYTLKEEDKNNGASGSYDTNDFFDLALKKAINHYECLRFIND